MRVIISIPAKVMESSALRLREFLRGTPRRLHGMVVLSVFLKFRDHASDFVTT